MRKLGTFSLYALILILSSVLVSAATKNSLGSFLELGFKGIFDALARKDVNIGLILLLMFILLYGIYYAALSKAFEKQGQNAHSSKTAKVAALCLSGISILGMFYGLTHSQILDKGQMIASGFSRVFAIIVAVIIFITIRQTFDKMGDTFMGKDTKNVGSWLGLGLALLIVGNVSGHYDFSGIGSFILFCLGVWLIIGIGDMSGGGSGGADVRAALSGLGNLSDPKMCEEALRTMKGRMRERVRKIDSLKTKIEMLVSSSDFSDIIKALKDLDKDLEAERTNMNNVIHTDPAINPSATTAVKGEAGGVRSRIETERYNIADKIRDIEDQIGRIRRESLVDLNNAKVLVTDELSGIFRESPNEIKKHAQKCVEDSDQLFGRADKEEKQLRASLGRFRADFNTLDSRAKAEIAAAKIVYGKI